MTALTYANPGLAPIEWKTAASPVAYPEAVAFMEDRVAAIAGGRAAECVWLLEHPPLYTAGTSAKPEDLLDTRFAVFQTGRGGQFTYHGPGQRVAYVMLDLRARGQDVRRFVFNLEEWIIRTLMEFHVRAERQEGRVGLWVASPSPHREKKIAAIGIRVRRWISFHGVAINIDPDLEHFSGIVPCGVADRGVTSLATLGLTATMAEFDMALRAAFEDVFGRRTVITLSPAA